MVNYYEILGLKTDAQLGEIKSAFRQLAKLYHPDVNPTGKEQFTTILKAYEILSDANRKYSYDYKLRAYANGQAPVETKRTAKDKHWRFDERELKRRQYYNEHIKKYEKKGANSANEPEVKSGYNEFKYILFATPLAVVIFLGIMTFASNKKHNGPPADSTKPAAVKKYSDLKLGDAPYTWYFGNARYDIKSSMILSVKNLTGDDVIVCLFHEGSFLRSFYMENSYSAEIPQLPVNSAEIRYSAGKYFSQDQKLPGTDVTGAFTENLVFYKGNEPVQLTNINELTLLPGQNTGFNKINAQDFFKK